MHARDYTICKSFDHSVVTGRRHYEFLGTHYENWGPDYIRRVYDHGFSLTVNSSCIGESPGRIDQCDFNGYLTYDELCNPCEKEEFKNDCKELCQTTTRPPFGPYILK